MAVDPPPNLTLEIDITSRTHPTIDQALGVSELWRFEREQLQIHILQNGNQMDDSGDLSLSHPLLKCPLC